MRYIYKLLTVFSFLLILSACSTDWLDTKPGNSLPTNTAISNYNDAVSALNGLYDGVQGNSEHTTYYAARMFYYGDVRGDDMQARVPSMRSSSCYEMNYSGDDAPAIWLTPYNVIRRANNLIKAIDDNKVVDATDNQNGDLKSQALVIRALAHFDLVKIYGLPYTVNNGASLGVPIVTTPLESNQLPKRNTVAEVYAQVVKDLKEAISLDKLSRAKTTGFVNLWAAKALLSRVYLYMGDNKNAYDVSVDVIDNSPYKLWSNSEYANSWAKAGSSEMIFEVINNNSSDWADRESIGYLLSEKGYSDIILTKSFTDMLKEDPNDVRLGVTLPSTTTNYKSTYGTERVFLNKFPGRDDFQPTDVRVNNLPLLRLSETYLNAAEAAIKNNDKPNAVKYLNQIVQRANPAAVKVTETDITLDRVLNERRKELVGEGHRFFDLLRNNKKVVRYTSINDMGWHYTLVSKESQSFDVTYFRAILPIPKYEVDANPNIREQQNPGY